MRGSGLPSVGGPYLADQATDGDDRVGQVEERVDDVFAAFVAALQPVEAVVPGVRPLDVPALPGLERGLVALMGYLPGHSPCCQLIAGFLRVVPGVEVHAGLIGQRPELGEVLIGPARPYARGLLVEADEARDFAGDDADRANALCTLRAGRPLGPLARYKHRSRIGEDRTFRLDRIADARTLPGSFEPPPGLDPAQRVLSGLAKAPYRHQVTLQIQGTIEQIRTRLPASVASVEEPPLLGAADPQTGRWLRVELRAERLDWLPPVLASLDLPFIIERPDELRSLVTALADRLAAPPAKVRRTNDRSGTVTWRSEGPSAGRSPAADVADEVLADQDGDADAAEEEDQHPDGIQVGLDKPERADDQPEQDDQGNRSDVSAAHVTVRLWENVERCSRVYPERGGGTH